MRKLTSLSHYKALNLYLWKIGVSSSNLTFLDLFEALLLLKLQVACTHEHFTLRNQKKKKKCLIIMKWNVLWGIFLESIPKLEKSRGVFLDRFTRLLSKPRFRERNAIMIEVRWWLAEIKDSCMLSVINGNISACTFISWTSRRYWWSQILREAAEHLQMPQSHTLMSSKCTSNCGGYRRVFI